MAPPTLHQLKDELDDLLRDYLEALSQYQHARTLLADHLKSAHFDLARAKLALGPGRVSPLKYDLTEHAAQKGVKIAPTSTSVERFQPASQEVAPVSSWAYSFDDVSPDASVEAHQGGESSRMRQRRRASKSPVMDTFEKDGAAFATADKDDDDDNAAAVEPSPLSRPAARPSPLAQFSALPPPSLRAAAAGFTRATDAAVRVVDAEARVRECARRVKRARRDVDRRVKEESVQVQIGGE